MKIRNLTNEEQKYTFRQSAQISFQTGSIGYLRGDFGKHGNEFYHTWFDINKGKKTNEFSKAFDELINDLRYELTLFHNLYDMKAYVRDNLDAAFMYDEQKNYGFRVDFEKYSCLVRCNTSVNDHNFYCFCYEKECLDQHIENAKQGIRFIDSEYHDMFSIADGEKVLITSETGDKQELCSRYIDVCHVEIDNTLYHICEFANLIERNGIKIEPKRKNKRMQNKERGRY